VPSNVLAGQDICDKDDNVSSLFIFMTGSCGYVCQSRYNRFKFIDFHIGYIFGLIDILGSIWGHSDHAFLFWYLYQKSLKYQFTVAAQETRNC